MRKFLLDISNGVKLPEKNGKYMLPKAFEVSGAEVKFIEFSDGIASLTDESGKIRYVLVEPIASLDRLLNAKTIGEMLERISLPGEVDVFKAVMPPSLLEPQGTTMDAMLTTLQLSFVRGDIIYFYSADIPLKRTASPVSTNDKEIGDNGPLNFVFSGKNMFVPTPPD